MESDICRLIFVHSVESLGQSDQWRAEDKVVHLSLLSTKVIRYFIFPFQPRQKDRLFRQPSAWSESVIGSEL